jgi:hypothetical protein
MKLATAYHEAGHAAMAQSFGVPVYWATITEDDDRHGHVERFDTPNQPHISLMISWAGPLAEWRVVRGPDQFESYEDGDGDFDKILRLSKQIAAGSGIFFTDDCAPEVAERFNRLIYNPLALYAQDKLYGELWPQVETLARALMECETLTGGEIEALLKRAGRSECRASGRDGGLGTQSGGLPNAMCFTDSQRPPVHVRSNACCG